MTPAGTTPKCDPKAVAAARHEYKERRRRDRSFGGRFGEPQWDILLDLYIATAEQREVRVSSACIAGAVPISTALRHIGYLAKRGLVVRSPHPRDNRSSVIQLTSSAIDLLNSHFGKGWSGIVESQPINRAAATCQ